MSKFLKTKSTASCPYTTTAWGRSPPTPQQGRPPPPRLPSCSRTPATVPSRPAFLWKRTSKWECCLPPRPPFSWLPTPSLVLSPTGTYFIESSSSRDTAATCPKWTKSSGLKVHFAPIDFQVFCSEFMVWIYSQDYYLFLTFSVWDGLNMRIIWQTCSHCVLVGTVVPGTYLTEIKTVCMRHIFSFQTEFKWEKQETTNLFSLALISSA